MVNTALGKVISSGIMPAYPFFILSIISTYEAFAKPLDQEITSQGYCYQALIYLYLRKQGVKNDEIDTYINFLTEFAYFFYFFVAKYLAEHREENLETIDSIINNLHKNENAYIAIFISHHSKNAYILDEIILNALCLFDKYEPATLTKDELIFFDTEIDNIVKAVLPPKNSSPAKVRATKLQSRDLIEEIIENEENQETKNRKKHDDALSKELRRSIKTVEVMGSIIKNRAGSLEKDKLEKVFEEAMKVHLRILSSFFDIIKHEKHQDELVDFIKSRLRWTPLVGQLDS